MGLINLHGDRITVHKYFAALFWAAILTGIFSQITFTRFERFRTVIIKESITPIDKSATVRFPKQFEAPREVLLLNLEIRNKKTGSKSIGVSLNSVKIGDIDLPPEALKQYFLEVKDEGLWADENRVDIRADGAGWEVTKFDIRNVYGYSSGLFRFIVIPRATEAVRGPSSFFLLGLFFLFFFCEILQISQKEHPPPRRVSLLLIKSFMAFFALFSILPLVSRYRILFGFNSLVIPTLILCFADRDYFAKFLSFLKKSFSRKELDKSPWKRHWVAIVFSALIFFFFYLVMAHSLKNFKGNYSGFVRFGKEFVNDRNPIFWNRSPQLLFANSDFEKGTLENWKGTGDAFHIQPARAVRPLMKQSPLRINRQGKYWLGINERYRKGDGRVPHDSGEVPATETLVSPRFNIQKEKIGFLIGKIDPSSGTTSSQQSVTLEVNGRIVGEDRGLNSEIMELHVWDVKLWVGQTARVIMANVPSPESDSRLDVDWFHYYQETGIKEGLLINDSGYDGQHFYHMTYDPFLSRFKDNPWKYSLMVDIPPYRYSRIGFSLLTKLVSLDRPKFYPRTMIWLILFSHFWGAFFLLKIVMFYQQSPFWTFLYLLIPGFQLSLQNALPESVAAAFLLAGVYFYLREKFLFMSLVFALSFLTRETGAVLAFGMIFFDLFKKKNIRNALLIGLSFIPLIFWRFYITWRLFEDFRWASLSTGSRNLRLPFSGFVRLYKVILTHQYPPDLTLAATIYPILLTCIFLFSVYFLWRRKDFLSLSLFAFSLISILLPYEKVWLHVGNGIRVTDEVVLFSIIGYVSQAELYKPRVKYLFLCLFFLFFIFFYLLPVIDLFFRKDFALF